MGGYDTAGFVIHGFLLDRGRYTTIDVPGASRTLALRINARGQILGDYEDERGGCHGFLLEEGRFETIDVPGTPTQAIGLNDRGQVAGTYIDAMESFHGFLFDQGRLHDDRCPRRIADERPRHQRSRPDPRPLPRCRRNDSRVPANGEGLS